VSICMMEDGDSGFLQSGGNSLREYSMLMLTACRLQFHCNLHAVNTHLTHAFTPNSICAECPEDGQVMPETCRSIDS
jgi:hypothetical protein